MASKGSKYNLFDIAQRTDPTGKMSTIAEVLVEDNQIVDDIMWVEGNQTNGHKSTIRTGYPSVAYAMYNYGVAQSKSEVETVEDSVGDLEGKFVIDKKLADTDNNKSELFMQEFRAFSESMKQTTAETIFYGTAAETKKFLGLSARYSAYFVEGTTAKTTVPYNVISAAGIGSDNTSVWLVSWNPNTVFGIYPKGSKAGLDSDDRGVQEVEDAAGNTFRAYLTYFNWVAGICVRDWRAAGRICNIDVSNLTQDASSGADLIKEMIILGNRVKQNGKTVWYVNETIFTYLDLQTYNKSQMNVSYKDDPHGKPVMYFRNVPVRKCDALINTEAAVAADS